MRSDKSGYQNQTSSKHNINQETPKRYDEN